MRYDYQVVPLSLDNGLYNHAVSSGKNYIMLLSAPPTANVRIRLGSKEADEIPLKENFAVRCSQVNEIFVSADELPGEKIHLVISSEKSGVMIDPSPQINSIEEITQVENVNNFSQELLTALDKIINPFELVLTEKGSTKVASYTTIFSKILDCDKIIVNVGLHDSSGASYGHIGAFINDIPICSADAIYASNGAHHTGSQSIELEVKPNDTLTIKAFTESGYATELFYLIKEFNKKA